MKIILRILLILLCAALIAGGFYLIVNNTSLASVPSHEEGRFPAASTADGTRPENFAQRPEFHPDGDFDEGGASLGRGLVGVFGSLIKLTVIVTVVLLFEKGFTQLGQKRTAKPV